jgi:hypothetical protein
MGWDFFWGFLFSLLYRQAHVTLGRDILTACGGATKHEGYGIFFFGIFGIFYFGSFDFT